MLAYTVYSEAGGVGKTTLTANLAVAHHRAGLDVLCIPLDPQDGDLSRLFDVDDQRSNPEIDTLVRHLVEREKGEFYELIRETADGPDIIPEHNSYEDLASHLQNEADSRESFGESFSKWTQMQRVLREASVHQQYDIVIFDPPASSGPALYNALDASRNIVLPVEPSGKGEASVDGLDDLVTNLEAQLDISIGVLAAVPNEYKGTTDQQHVVDELRAAGFAVPEVLPDRTSLLEGCWRKRCSAYRYIAEHRDRRRDYEIETLAQFDRLARAIETAGGVEAPSPPEPGSLDDEPEVTA